MNRRNFLTLSGTGLLAMTAAINYKSSDKKMPALFIGHGSPMNALANNDFTKHLEVLGQTLPVPKKILMISAHWMTKGVELQASSNPKMIYDFYGFPEALYKINYPAPGDVTLASSVKNDLSIYQAELDHEWGFDHGNWSVLHHMYPKANIPVVQLSLNQNFMNLRDHLTLAKQLNKLRNEGVLIIGSGNIVHNLRQISRSETAPVVEWAHEFDELIKKSILENNLEQLLAEDPSKHSQWKMAHPSIEHYLPLLYVLGAADPNEKILFPYEAFELGSLSMRSVLVGA
ncbi:4,5-DOPA dioxygenase extradiol [Bacteriovorax sp. PP10]|uniref:4,5-DOPA dioxygenase extradiol n=1 Tax=Bacteriovorax antarcticus TaxID=3088717 RepID=A0ABU5VNE1_9BACT|nr:4,5-DOPA dioxygenase extradiol [Bacteriovorax sp. PP10]MEA9354565.1 4,5-DOPA dioxygenase extradiol [Bacteriovorax sp. PP10]